MYQAIAVKTWFSEAFWQARAGSGYSLVRHASGNVVFQFPNQATEGGQAERERDTTHGDLGWFDGGVDFYSRGFIGRARWGFGGIGRYFNFWGMVISCSMAYGK